jgi:hypothetical protein
MFCNVQTWSDGGDLFNDAVEYCLMPDRGRYVESDDDDSVESDDVDSVDRLVIDSLRRTFVGLTHSAWLNHRY